MWSNNITISIEPAKERLANLLKEIKLIHFVSPEPNTILGQQEEFYILRKRILEDRILQRSFIFVDNKLKSPSLNKTTLYPGETSALSTI